MRHFVGVAEATAGVSPKVLNEISFLSTGLWPSIMPTGCATCSPHRERMSKPPNQPSLSRDVLIVAMMIFARYAIYASLFPSLPLDPLEDFIALTCGDATQGAVIGR